MSILCRINKASAFIASVLIAGAATAQSYPERPIRLVVPYLAGGGVDTVARLVGQKLGANLGQTIVVDNRPGAAGNIGADIVAKAKPDGYTLLLSSSALVANISIYPKMPYDLLTDLAPITLIGVAPNWLVVSPTLPVNSVKDLIIQAANIRPE